MFVRGTALPEYTYFVELDQLRHFSGLYAGEALLLFNQLSVQAGGATAETLSRVNTEVENPVLNTTDIVYANGELDLARRFSIYAAAEAADFSYEEEGPFSGRNVNRLTRDVTTWQGGLRYDVLSFFQVSALYEQSETEFSISPLDRNFETNAILAGVHYDAPRFYVNLSAGPRTIKSTTPGRFESYDTVTGSGYIAYEMGAPAVVSLFGNRSLRASTFEENALFIEQRIGAQIETALGERALFRVTGATGENDYPLDEAILSPRRVDDVQQYGGGMSWRLFRSFWLDVDASRTEYDSNISQYDRSILKIQTTVSFRR